MARNRRNQSAAVRFGPALKAFAICLVIGGSALGYVYQKSEIYKLGQLIKQSEIRLEELHRHNNALQRALASLSSPRELDERIRKMNLGLAAPQPEQIVRLPDGSSVADVSVGQRFLAGPGPLLQAQR
ncbi:MAG: hypothetical protein HY674_14090 [Chloroflexi bacterium]|nr:hypothetical protein [Chloroflexota bacterium]